ncbi:MAG: exodeoxyribonuclease VII small subunit [Holophagales bacterium]|nr:exodeoxyribonuclease VII small subunit [Holophagales bacterium]
MARGGGSRDDLSAFNDERVVRAVAASRIPTISAVGHEIDVTLTDLAADLRAATPSQAAELVVARRDDFEARIEGLGRELTRTLKGRLLAAHADAARLLNAPALAGFPARAGALSARASSAARELLSAVRRLPAAYRERLLRAEGAVASWPVRAAFPLGLARAEAGERAVTERLERRLEDPERGLEASLELFEEGVALSRFCRGKLEEIQKRVDVVLRETPEGLVTEPLDAAAPDDEEGEDEA